MNKVSGDFAFIRRALGLTQVQFAKLIGTSVANINFIEKGKIIISYEILCKTYVEMMGILRMSKELNLSEEEIFCIEKFKDKLKNSIDELDKNFMPIRLEIFKDRS